MKYSIYGVALFFGVGSCGVVVGQTNTWLGGSGTNAGGVGHDATIYLNGVSDATGTRTGTPRTDTAPLTIGKAANHTFFPGRLDEVAIYNRALTPEEVFEHYTVGITGVPEPSSVILLAGGFLLLGHRFRRNRYPN